MLRERPLFSGCSPPARGKVRGGFAAWALALGLCLFSSPPLLPSAEPPAIAGEPDLRHELMARRVLLRDPLLGPLNLGVRVHRHVAFLWGTVPSAELARRAVGILMKQIPEFTEVRNELQIQPLDITTSPVPAPKRPAPLPAVPRPLAPPTGVLTKQGTQSPQVTPSPVGYPQWKPPDQAAFAPPDRQAGPLLPTIAIPRPPVAPIAATPPGEWLIEAVTRVQRSDPRFRQLRPEVRGQTVRLDGSVERWADVYDLAQRITQLRGVERVVLSDIQTTTEPASRPQR